MQLQVSAGGYPQLRTGKTMRSWQRFQVFAPKSAKASRSNAHRRQGLRREPEASGTKPGGIPFSAMHHSTSQTVL